MDDDGWTIVGAPRRRKSGGPAGHKQAEGHKQAAQQQADEGPRLPGWSHGDGGSSATLSTSAPKRRRKGPQTTADQLDTCKQIIQDCIQDVKGSRVFAETASRICAASELLGCTDCMETISQLVIYGLGSVEDHRVSRFQLAMGELLRELLPKLQGPPLLFDPVFSEQDVQLLRSFGMDIITENEEGRRTVQQPTFFYLAHCEAWLCDNLLAANWTASQLPQVVILGNSFSTYRQRWSCPSSRPAKGPRPDKMLHLVEKGAVVELPIRDFGYHVTSAFNDLSLHVFPASKLLQADLPS